MSRSRCSRSQPCDLKFLPQLPEHSDGAYTESRHLVSPCEMLPCDYHPSLSPRKIGGPLTPPGPLFPLRSVMWEALGDVGQPVGARSWMGRCTESDYLAQHLVPVDRQGKPAPCRLIGRSALPQGVVVCFHNPRGAIFSAGFRTYYRLR